MAQQCRAEQATDQGVIKATSEIDQGLEPVTSQSQEADQAPEAEPININKMITDKDNLLTIIDK